MARHTGKYILILLLAFPLLQAADYPRPQGYVNDFAGVISGEHQREIESIARSLSEAGSIELAVVTVPSLDGLDITAYAIGLAESWGVGRAGEDTGVIFLLAPNEREVRIEVGYGLEGDLPDGLTGEILDRFVVGELRQNQFSSGMLEGSRAIAATLADRRGFELQQVQVSSYAQQQEQGGDANYLYFLLLLLLVFGRGRMWPLLFLMGRGGRRYPRGGGFGASPRGGSFGGFGGGGFGGGGASRSF